MKASNQTERGNEMDNLRIIVYKHCIDLMRVTEIIAQNPLLGNTVKELLISTKELLVAIAYSFEGNIECDFTDTSIPELKKLVEESISAEGEMR